MVKYQQFFYIILLYLLFLSSANAIEFIHHSLNNREEGYSKNWCRGGIDSNNPPYGLAKIININKDKILLQSDEYPECPNLNTKKCSNIKKQNLRVDDIVLTSNRRLNGFICSEIASRSLNGYENGWIFENNLAPIVVNEKPTIDAWIGNWKNHANEIVILKEKNNFLHVIGQAVYETMEHEGNIEAFSKPNGNYLELSNTEDDTDDSACHIGLNLINEYLIVYDNSNCGGINVRFNGIYQKVSN